MSFLTGAASAVKRVAPGGWSRAVAAEAALGGAAGAVSSGTVLIGLLLWSGASLFEISLLSAVTTGGGLLVVFANRLRKRIPAEKRLTQLAWTLAWVLWAPLGAIVLALGAFGQPGSRLVPIAVLLTAFAVAGATGIGNVIWNSWVARIVHRDGRGVFLAGRARWLSAAGLLVFPVVGYLLDQGRSSGREAFVIGSLLIIPGLLAAGRYSLLSAIPPSLDLSGSSAAATPRSTGGAVSVQRYTTYTLLWQVGVYLGGPFFQVYALQRVGLSFMLLMNLQILSQIIPILTLGWWGRVIDRIGVRRPLVLCSLGKILVPLCYLASTPEMWWPLVIGYLLSILDAGLTVSNGTSLTHIAEGPSGSARVANISLLTSLTAGVTPVLAGLMVSGLQANGHDALAIAFVASAVGRAVAGISLVVPWPNRRRLAALRLAVARRNRPAQR